MIYNCPLNSASAPRRGPRESAVWVRNMPAGGGDDLISEHSPHFQTYMNLTKCPGMPREVIQIGLNAKVGETST